MNASDGTPTLWDTLTSDPSVTIPPPEHLARTNDPATSKAAASRAKRETIIRRLLLAYLWNDYTAEEAAKWCGFSAQDGAWKRVSDCIKAGYLEPVLADGEIVTRAGSSGRQQRVLTITPAGCQVVA